MVILYVFPHPDDESFGPGPAIARQRREGHQVHLLTLTKGGATKQRHRLGLSVDEMGEVRRREMDCVQSTLDLSGMTVLDLPDGGLKYMDPLEIEEVIAAEVERVRPDVLVTYAVHGISGHPDHLVCHAVVTRLYCHLRRQGSGHAPRRLALFTLVDGELEDAPPHLRGSKLEDIGVRETFTPRDLEAGKAALACYETYRETVEEHKPLDRVVDGVAFELFGERFEQTLSSITESVAT